MDILAGLVATALPPLVFFAILAGLFALWIFLIRRFYPPRKP
jgi:hypothetical protein